MSDISVLLERLERLLKNVHQYVGARYVPNFIDDPWSDIRDYEALDVVDNGTGTSYIAKKPVPAGTPLSDREYWFVYGSTSGAIINLQNQIDAIVSDLDDTNTSLSNVRSGAKTILYIGDSFMYGPGVLTQSLNARLKVADSYNFSHGATGFIKDVDDLNFYHQLEAAAASTLFDNADITDIIIAGGINDDYANSLTDYVTALQSMKTVISTNFVNAKVWIIPMLWKNTPLDNDDQKKYYKIYRACINSGYAVYPDAFTILIGLDSSYMLDSVHPSAKGCELIADYIGSWINDGISQDERIEDFTVSLDGTGSCGGQIVLRNGFLYLYVFLYLRGYNYQPNEKILDLPDIFYLLNPQVKIPCNYTVSAGTYSGGLYIKDAKLYADTAIGSADIHVNAIMPVGYIY